MVIETLWPDNAPWWLNLFIWMATFWWYILVGFVPAFYIAVAKLFGMPLLQRWQNEVVITLMPSKVKFNKITEQMEPYFMNGKGVYWYDKPLAPSSYEELDPKQQDKLDEIKIKYEQLAEKKGKTKKDEQEMVKLLKQSKRIEKRVTRVQPINQLHIYTHAINQSIYNMERRPSKVDEILNNNPSPKKIKPHGIWILQNPKLHFHRHWQVVIAPSQIEYKLIPVKEKQQFGIGFWHSLGIVLLQEVEQPTNIDIEGGGAGGKRLVGTLMTTNVVLQQIQEIQDYQNFSASRAYMLLKRRARIESPYGFNSWIQGSFDARILLLLAGMIGGVAAIFLFLHGGGGSAPAHPGGPIL